MQIVSFDAHGWVNDHPTGTISFQHLFRGVDGSADNFMFILGRQDADFFMPRHRHNFDQIRLPLRGTMNHGEITIGEGQIGYIPEGLAYGPQSDPLAPFGPGERLQLVLQFGGASGCGFMSIEQRRAAVAALKTAGTMDGPYYRRNDGTTSWGLNAIWEHVFGVPIRYPRPRYRTIAIADPERFNWLPVRGSHGVERKFMGAFSERGVRIEMMRVAAGATWTSAEPDALRLFFVLEGEATAGDAAVGRYDAMRAEAGESIEITASRTCTLFLIVLPPIVLPSAPSTEFDADELPVEALHA